MNDAALPTRLGPQALIGTWRRFGPVGPVYEVVDLGPTLPNGETLVRVRVLETAEELDYRLTALLSDPPAQ